VPDCENAHIARDLCTKHYQRAREAGELPPLPPTTHILSSVDRAALRATCALCGPDSELVSLRGGNLMKCANKHRADCAKKSARRKADTPEQRAKRNEYHRTYARAQKYKLNIRRGLLNLLAASGWACEICGAGLTERSARVDHDHACCDSPSGDTCGRCVRGVLCNRCNTALGFFADDTQRLTRAIEYLGGQIPLSAA
jgi:hypothetical protein